MMQPSLSLIPSPYVVCHTARYVSSEVDPATGNPVIVDLPPVIRLAQGISENWAPAGVVEICLFRRIRQAHHDRSAYQRGRAVPVRAG